MAYNNHSGGSGASGLAGLVVVLLLGVGLFGRNSDDNYSSSNNSDYIDSTEEIASSEDGETVESEILIDSSITEEDLDSAEGFIKVEPETEESYSTEEAVEKETLGVVSEEDIPAYASTNTITLNDNHAAFTEEEIATTRSDVADKGYVFSEIDSLNRASTAVAILTPEMYNTEERDSITVDPTGWKNKRLTEGSWLYNRSHLIAYSFINADIDIIPNLITGTRDFNADRDWGMLHYEDIVREYVSENGDFYNATNEIVYQVTPVFEGDNKLALGVQMRVQSLMDDSLDFNVFIYNVQENVELNYVDGTSVDHTKAD